MKLSQVALQLYTLRDQCQTAAAFAATVRRVREIGYTAVQLSGVGPIAPAEIVRVLAGEGLTLCATHEPSEEILDQPERSIERLHQLSCALTAYAWPAGIDFTSAASIEVLVQKLDAAGAKFSAAGLTLGYHHHAIEFVPFRGAPVLDYIFSQTDPRHVVAELDTYWVQYGGGDSVDWCRRLRGRLPFIHLKDYVFTPQNVPAFGEIGAGTLPFPRIIAEAERSGCTWFIVEQDTCPGDPFDSIRQSFEYIKQHLTA
jgi:sugar phosphate isomerase/epimerase